MWRGKRKPEHSHVKVEILNTIRNLIFKQDFYKSSSSSLLGVGFQFVQYSSFFTTVEMDFQTRWILLQQRDFQTTYQLVCNPQLALLPSDGPFYRPSPSTTVVCLLSYVRWRTYPIQPLCIHCDFDFLNNDHSYGLKTSLQNVFLCCFLFRTSFKFHCHHQQLLLQ